MANTRLYNPATRFYLAFPGAFEDWQNPTVAELNANPTNAATGLIFNLTCAIDQDGTTHDLGDSDTDDSLSFCQVAGAQNRTNENPDITWQLFRSTVETQIKNTLLRNTATLAFDLLFQPDVEYYAIMSVGEDAKTAFDEDDQIKMAKVSTEYPTDVYGTNENVRETISFLNRGDVLWNYKLEA